MNVLGINDRLDNRDSPDLVWLKHITERISRSASLQETLDDLVGFVAQVFDCDSCMVYVCKGDGLVLAASKNAHPQLINKLALKLGQGIAGWVAKQGEPVVVNEAAYNDPRFKTFSALPEDRFEAILSIPLISGGRVVGVINLQNRERQIHSATKVKLLGTLGFLVGTEIELARLNSENAKLIQRLDSCEEIEKAITILQADSNLTQRDAYSLLQRESRQRRKSMKQVAEAVILYDELKNSSSSAYREKTAVRTTNPKLLS